MTPNESDELARRIWGSVFEVEPTKEGGAYVNVDPEAARRAVSETHLRGDAFANHHLDTNGHPTCHTACRQREDDLQRLNTLELRAVLAAAYRGKHPAQFLTHAVILDDNGAELRALCGRVALDHLADREALTPENRSGAPTCAVCLARWRVIQRRPEKLANYL